METRTADGAVLHYEVAGTGTPIVFTHGFAATSAMWDAQLPELAAAHQVVRWDIRGHGRTRAPGGYTLERTLEDIRHLLDVIDAPRAILAGLSLGGFISLAFRDRYPECTSGLILMDTGPGYRDDDARAAWNARIVHVAEALEETGLEALTRLRLTAPGCVHDDAGALAAAARGILTQSDARVIDSLSPVWKTFVERC